MKLINLESKINESLRILPIQKKALIRLNIETVRDLLYYFPIRYSSYSNIKYINQLNHDDQATVFGIISNPSIKKTYRGETPTAQATLTDINGDSLKIIWFNQAFIAKTLKNGQIIKISGKITEGKYGLSLINPEFERIKTLPIDTHGSLFSNNQKEIQNFGYPIYRETRGITSKWIYHAVLKILKNIVIEDIHDPIPEYIREKYHLPTLETALVWIHAPQKKENADAARKRFAFEEIFYIQLENQQRRYIHRKKFSYTLTINEVNIKKFINRFPFSPTQGQKSALKVILEDMSSLVPMSRLLEGDVGSGKTFVAALATYATVSNKPQKQSFGHLQVAYMAPTEVLAIQLFENFINYFKGINIQIGLLTGSGCRKFPSKVHTESWTTISRRQLLQWVQNAEIPILIGTHALIQKNVMFKNLGLVIIDEQHRFGTRQRMSLANKDKKIPHYLSMTATPIPRTLALTMYGDLDLSVIDTMPIGRKKIITKIIPPLPEKREDVYKAIRNSLKEGRQAYVICPRIDEADPQKETALQLTSVLVESKRLKEHEFKDYRIDIMHSKMKKSEKETVMSKFYNHDIDILVSTSVIEVGVNVPNATNIIIEGVERFGLAQLHQLRGRVMRSNYQAYCYLFANVKSKKTIQRLQAIVQAKNGFELAEIDLSLRGAGDLAGIKQWGMSDLAMEAIKNIKMVEYARIEAKNIIENDLELENFPELKNSIRKQNYHIHFE